VQRFLGGLVFKAHRLVYHSTLGWGEIKTKKEWTSSLCDEDLRRSAAPAADPIRPAGRTHVCTSLVRHDGPLELRAVRNWYSSQVKNNHFTEICCGTEAGSFLRLIDSCSTQLKAQGPSRFCNERKEEEVGRIQSQPRDWVLPSSSSSSSLRLGPAFFFFFETGSCLLLQQFRRALFGTSGPPLRLCRIETPEWRGGPPWRQPRGKWMVSLVNSHTNATRIGWHLWDFDLRFAPGLPPGWGGADQGREKACSSLCTCFRWSADAWPSPGWALSEEAVPPAAACAPWPGRSAPLQPPGHRFHGTCARARATQPPLAASPGWRARGARA